MKTIVAGYDGSRPAEAALRRAAEYAQAFGAKVVVVSVAAPVTMATPTAFGLTPYASDQAEDVRVQLEVEEAVWDSHREQVEALFAAAAVPVEFAGTVGAPVEQIVEHAEQAQADLIVVGTREPGFLDRMFGGSVSQGVARHAHCDVLIVHSDD